MYLSFTMLVCMCLHIKTQVLVQIFMEFFIGVKGKGKVHPCTGTEALYRPYGP